MTWYHLRATRRIWSEPGLGIHIFRITWQWLIIDLLTRKEKLLNHIHFWAEIRRVSVSLSRFPFICYALIFSEVISSVMFRFVAGSPALWPFAKDELLASLHCDITQFKFVKHNGDITWCSRVSAGLWPPSKRVRTPVTLLRLFSL